MILLSILIPSIPSRFESHLIPLWKELQRQCDESMYGSRVEILTVCDNKQRTIGAKRQALLNLAQGKYVAFMDDDDKPSKYYYDVLSTIDFFSMNIDVITFNQHVSINGELYPLTFKFGHEVNEEPNKDGFTRPPWHVCFWRREVVQHCTFPNSNYGEDWSWAEQANKCAKTSYHIDEFMMTYVYDVNVSEATI